MIGRLCQCVSIPILLSYLLQGHDTESIKTKVKKLIDEDLEVC